MNKLLRVIPALSLSLGLGATRVHAACQDPSTGIDGGVSCAPAGISLSQGITNTVNTLLFIVGVASVIMIIVGGLRYIFSGGDPKNTSAAKDTILYAVIGIVVAILAYAIVNFILGQFGGTAAG
jgi:hypothetical protein